jgi:hypothetical protein
MYGEIWQKRSGFYFDVFELERVHVGQSWRLTHEELRDADLQSAECRVQSAVTGGG